ncbi:nucleotide-sugar transporter-domain-containing protein [Rhodofomes roseus]|uniref:Nucleotide-sugar transporter-domain-containing protein n=1 Tax=Rhodofomes roseus TaxID=34475 RepID=A0ABQ8KV99_9APHY|nr:nucleotide-sugar transporter-domain-containing protein [Rhodofomes roseus]KAH9842741.1 nucleotide-sugar transporter-domain-containing protein [Rhodofomes roseus]
MAHHDAYHDAQHRASHLKEADAFETEELGIPLDSPTPVPSVCGLPLKYVSLVTLAVQNALLTLIMHYSRVSAAPSETYSAAAAVLMTELLKGSISLLVAFSRLDCTGSSPASSLWNPRTLFYRFRRLGKEVFRPDCWKLSIPAILYVIQNNLQFVAVSNLEAATFQVSYQMKILTTAAFSVVLLRRKLSPTKWLALLFLAIGVGIVQIQGGSSNKSESVSHEMNALKGFMAVVAACFTSGLAGVYFEMVLKNSPGDLWVRNVQLSLFSLLPALLPVIVSRNIPTAPGAPVVSLQLFANFGVWAWATVAVQVLGGLLTALVIKYADNILKGFATSLSIVISFLASVALFNFRMTLTFILGSTVVLVATWMYNQPDASSSTSSTDGSAITAGKSWSWRWRRPSQPSRSSSGIALAGAALSRRASTSSLSSLSSFHMANRSNPTSPVERDAPILGQLLEKNLLTSSKKQDDPSRLSVVLSAFPPLRALSRLLSSRSHSYTPLPTTSPGCAPTASALVFSATDNAYAFPPAFQPQPVPATSSSSSLAAPHPPLSSRPPSALSHASRPASAASHHAPSQSAPSDFAAHTHQ